MAEEVKAPDALAPASPQGGQPVPASDGKAQDAEAEQKQGPEGLPKKVNLQEVPGFKEFQSAADKRQAELERRAAGAEQREADARKRLEALEDQAYGKDDYGKMQLFAQRKAQEAEALRAELAAVKTEREAESAKQNALREIADEFEVPVSVLAGATDYKHAMKLARTERDQRLEAKLKERDETRTANKPDLGGGGHSTAKTRWDSEFEDAMKRRDSVAVARLPGGG